MYAMKKILLIALLLLLIPSTSFATTYTAADCEDHSVAAEIAKTSDGDTVFIPPGTCTWTTPITITKSIYLIGAGPTSTIINHGYAGNLIEIYLSTDVDVRISGLSFVQASNPGRTAIQITGKKTGTFAYTKVRIDNNKFERGSRTVHAVGWVEGLIDNNTFLNCNIGIGASGDDNYSWTRAITASTANALFIENNTFTTTNDIDRSPNQAVYVQQGGRVVTRYNTFDSSTYSNGDSSHFDSHGNQFYYGTGTFRGQPIIEIYNNVFKAHHSYGPFDIRSGSSLIHHNTFTTVTGAYRIEFWEQEAWETQSFNPLDTVWPAEDQVTNTFFWANTVNGVTVTDDNIATYLIRNGVQDYTFIRDGYELFAHEPAATGGKSTYTDRPGAAGNGADGTMTFSSEGANAYYPYTEYTCPHPLADPSAQGACDSDTPGRTGYTLTGGGSDETAPTVLTVYVNGATMTINFSEPITSADDAAFTLDPSGADVTVDCPAVATGATSMACTISRAIVQAETATYAYSDTKVIDAASNALAAITPTAITANQTPAEAPTAKLTVNKTGAGCTVTSSPSGISFSGASDDYDFNTDTVVTLSGWSENGWNAITYGGDCASNGTVTMNAAKECTATCTEVTLFP